MKRDYKIEKNVPYYNYWESMINKMQYGDSILFPTRGHARGLKEKMVELGFKYKCQPVPDGYRVWKSHQIVRFKKRTPPKK